MRGYEQTHEAAMAAFEKSWRAGVRRSPQTMPLERTVAFTHACIAVLLVVALAMVFLS